MDSKNPATAPRRKHMLLNAVLAVPVFVKVMGIALAMALLLGGGILWQIHRTWHGRLIQELERRGQVLANETGVHCHELIRTGRTAEIAAELRHSLVESANAVYVVMQSSNGTVLAEARSLFYPTNRQQICELSAPVGKGPDRLVVGMSTERVDKEVDWLTSRLTKLTAIITLLGLLGAWGLTHIFAHPILELVTLTRAVKSGNYQVKAHVRANDEVGELAGAFNEMTAAIAEKEAARQQLLGQLIRAGEEERKRIARELHDQTGQALTSQIAALSALESHCPDEKCHQRLIELRQQTEQMLADVHDLSVTLRPAVLDDVGLMAALEKHCRLFSRRMNVVVDCRESGLDGKRLPPEVELTIYRLAQEALNNAVRHGQATEVVIEIERVRFRVRVVVRDNGKGFDTGDWRTHCTAGNHLGLRGIEERVVLLGGILSIESTPQHGTFLSAEIPVKPEAGA